MDYHTAPQRSPRLYVEAKMNSFITNLLKNSECEYAGGRVKCINPITGAPILLPRMETPLLKNIECSSALKEILKNTSCKIPKGLKMRKRKLPPKDPFANFECLKTPEKQKLRSESIERFMNERKSLQKHRNERLKFMTNNTEYGKLMLEKLNMTTENIKKIPKRTIFLEKGSFSRNLQKDDLKEQKNSIFRSVEDLQVKCKEARLYNPTKVIKDLDTLIKLKTNREIKYFFLII